MLVLALGGCPAEVQRLGAYDAGPRDSGRPQDGGSPMVQVRPDGGPILPAADLQVSLPLGSTAAVPFDVRASPAALDLHLNVDTTSSMGGEIANLVSTLDSVIVPDVRAVVADVSFGVSHFEDFPAAPWGSIGVDVPFELLQPITSSVTAAGNAVGVLTRLGNGGDLPEAGYESLFQVAAGEGYVDPSGRVLIADGPRSAAVGGGTLGGVGFRDGSYRVAVHVTDAESHEGFEYAAVYPGVRGFDDAVAALQAKSIHVVGIASSSVARPGLEALALATDSTMAPVAGTCPTGIGGASRNPVNGTCPLVFDVSGTGSGLSASLVDGVTALIANLRFAEVRASVTEDRLGLVTGIVASSATTPTNVPAPTTRDATPGDGLDDTFVSVYAGSTLRFQLMLRNDTLPSLGYDQDFRVRVRVVAGNVVLVDQIVRIVVPA